MPKIVPHFWFDREAKEAAIFYTSLFENSRILHTALLMGTPSGDAETVSFELAGQPFEAISAGPFFKFNPSISLMVSCGTKEEVDMLWKALSDGGEPLMPLGEYPFSGWYGWIQDRYGLSWQLMLTEERPVSKIRVCLLFADGVCGMAEEAVNFYIGLFPRSEIELISRYAEGEAASPAAKVNYAAFTLDGALFTAMDHGMTGDFRFNEAVSLIVKCRDQDEIDNYWEKLSAVPEAEQCGWLKDRFGVSWQIVPENMDEVFAEGDRGAIERVTRAFLPMKKLDIAELERARLGERPYGK